jgi:hypothetical protein
VELELEVVVTVLEVLVELRLEVFWRAGLWFRGQCYGFLRYLLRRGSVWDWYDVARLSYQVV